ncbi:c-type cytochrome [Chlorobaculum sp. MV4-Y]|uniref:c-type cytochrome n=1 Tax=Chlorobaculum sp. MV4-Y TaxID=2976335 RepID=UPI0021AE9C0D|nr:c-type cytochrome [Chlorobaculum sp. MV4-Y]UWX57705.1 c-type cytochrome [Chlorobaculum sp. MV4-Y]
MKRFLPLFVTGLVFLGGCGLEKPPAKLAEEIKNAEKPAEEAAAPAAAPAPAPAATPTDPALAAGKAVYEGGCNACHDAGMMGAPKPGDKAAWAPRIAKGEETVIKNTINGINGMPAKGGNTALTDEQLTNAAKYMMSISK